MSKASFDDRRFKLYQNKLSALFGRVQQIYDSSVDIDGDDVKFEASLANAYTIDKLREDFSNCVNERNEYQLLSQSDKGTQLIEIFSAGLAGFDSVKFTSNSTEVLKNIPVAHRMSELVEFSSDSQLKILGLHWSPSEDSFVFSVNVEQRKCTKRNILSTIARLWDVMGFVAPLKSLWKNNIDWDEKPPSNISSLWQQFEAELPLLKNLKMSRHV
ncbi:unnamed protein product [Leptosia nina]|uniref:Uncharacterized protein n=1 Tax=Leptosia nina TaxID=320188 RepID=A0AAV1J5B7_9NEOP